MLKTTYAHTLKIYLKICLPLSKTCFIIPQFLNNSHISSWLQLKKTYPKAFSDCLNLKHQFKNCAPIISDQLTCLLRNLYAGQEATVRTGHGTTDWFQIGKGVRQDCILSPCLFNLYAEYIMRNAGLEEAQAGIKIAVRNINNLRCRRHHPYGRKWRGTEKPLDQSERGELKSWLKAQHSENEDHGIWSHHFMGNRWGNSGYSVRLYFGGLQNHCRWWLQPWN